MNFQVKLIKNEQRKAVAPIIATLLMVAISVVGGILIFVFAQGFFQDTSIQSPTIDALEIFGYNANDTATGFFLHNGEDVDIGGTETQTLTTADPLGVYIRNIGSTTVVIEKVKMYGVNIPFDSANAGAALGTGVPGNGKLLLVQTEALKHLPSSLIEPGQEVTLIIRYDAPNINGDVKIGRPILIKIQTGQGSVFIKQFRNGVESG